MDEPSALEVPLAPEGVLSRVRDGINRPPKRTLGLKMGPEFVGVVQGNAFEIWERGQHAVHLLGQVKGVRGGSRVELRTSMSLRTKVFVVVFFVIFVAVAWGFATLPSDRPAPAFVAPLGALTGGAAAALIIWHSARSQRRALRKFVGSLLGEERAR